MARDPSCIFCKIIAAEIPASVVFEDDAVLAFLDVSPLAEGHTLIIPREHYREMTDMPPAAAGRLLSVVPRLGWAIVQVTAASGFNVLVNNGSAAGQVVPHVHVHVVPRVSGDGLGYRWNAGKYSDGRAGELAQALQAALQPT